MYNRTSILNSTEANLDQDNYSDSEQNLVPEINNNKTKTFLLRQIRNPWQVTIRKYQVLLSCQK